MTALFVDASALVAMMTKEADDQQLIERLGTADWRLYSPVVQWEAVTAIARKRSVSIAEAEAALGEFVARFDLRPVAIDAATASGALTAWERFGKGNRHPAQLNMGDCFAYACAKANGARLLYKGDDFAQTDLA